LLQWLQSLHTDRTQKVIIADSHSLPCHVTSGVPQGSVFGLVLFLIYINNIIANIHSQLRLFANDCLLRHPIHSFDDHEILQSDLDSLTSWANIWQMEFKVKKCCIVQISTLHSTSSFPYKKYEIPFQFVKNHHYLGILLDNKLP